MDLISFHFGNILASADTCKPTLTKERILDLDADVFADKSGYIASSEELDVNEAVPSSKQQPRKLLIAILEDVK